MKKKNYSYNDLGLMESLPFIINAKIDELNNKINDLSKKYDELNNKINDLSKKYDEYNKKLDILIKRCEVDDWYYDERYECWYQDDGWYDWE